MNVRARPLVLRGELVNRNSREEPVCSKCRDGLVIGARPGELVNEIYREESVYSKCRDGLVAVNVRDRSPVLRGELVNRNCGEEPVCLKYSEGLVIVAQ